jgi:hypothetical protein
LPVDRLLARRRAAFRADVAGDVTFTLSAVAFKTTGEGRQARTTFEKTEIPVLLGDVVVSALKFPGKNVLFDGGPGSGSNPAGSLSITAFPVDDGVSSTKEEPYTCPTFALKMVNGQIANQETAYGKAPEVSKAEWVVGFQRAQTLSSIVVYEDPAGPAPAGEEVKERATPRYGIDVCTAGGQWTRLGQVVDNTQLINIFPCPTNAIIAIRYIWASNYDNVSRGRGDGAVRGMQFEAYSVEDVGSIIQDKLESDTGDLPTLD